MKEYIDADVPEGDPKPSRWVHYGMTSSDLGDTALCYQLTQACDLIIEDARSSARFASVAPLRSATRSVPAALMASTPSR